MKRLASLWLVCQLTSILSAQEPTPLVLPLGPLLNKAPDFAQWTITTKGIEQPTADAEPADSPSKPEPSPSPTTRHRQKPAESGGKKPVALSDQQITVVTKTQTTRREEASMGTGPKTQKWCVPDMQVTIGGSAAPVVSLSGGSANSDYVDYTKTDFPGFEWIDGRNFIGIKTVMGQECLIFQDQAQPKKKDAAAQGSSTAVASINAATRLPVALQTEDETQIYEFGLAPTAMLALPPEVQAVVDQWRKTMSQSALMPAKP